MARAPTRGDHASLDQVEARLSYVIGRLDRVLRKRLNTALRPYGLTVPEYTALSVLRARDGLSNAQLARRSLITPQSMSEVLVGLVERGLVRRRADPAHGRAIRTELTKVGRAVLATCDKAVDEIEREMLADMAPGDREQLLASLTSCVRTLGAGLSDR